MNRHKTYIITLFLICPLLAYPEDMRETDKPDSNTGKIEWRFERRKPETEPIAEELRVGVDAGTGMTRVFSSNLSQPFRINESAGVFVNLNEGGFLFETGLKWHRRNYHLTGFIPKYSPTLVSARLNPNYLEIPLMLGGMFKLVDFGKADVSAGLKIGMYFACGIGGDGQMLENDDSGEMSQYAIDNVFKSSQSFNGLKRFDTGGKVGMDIYIKRWKIGFEYTRGWIDMSNSFDRHVKTKSFDFTIGYVFGYRIKGR